MNDERRMRTSIRRHFRRGVITLLVAPLSLLVVAVVIVGVVLVPRGVVQRQHVAATYAVSYLRSLAAEYQKLFGQVAAINGLASAAPEELQSQLDAIVHNDRTIQRLLLLDNTGQVVARAIQSDDRGIELDDVSSEFSAFRLVTEGGRPYMGEFYVSDSTGLLVFRVSVPVAPVRNDRSPDVMIADVVIDFLEDALADLPLQPGETVYLLDETGAVVGHRDADDVPEATWDPAQSRDGFGLGIHGRAVVMASASVVIGDATYYGIVQQELYPSFLPILVAVVLTGGIVALVIHGVARAGGFVFHRLVTPIERLREGIERIGAGDYSIRLAHPSIRELSRLAEGINSMTGIVDETIASLRASVDERDVLLHEVHHRVRNNLQVISSLVSMKADRLSRPELLDAFLSTKHRVRSMALVHEQLYEAESMTHIRVDRLLRQLADQFAASDAANTGHIAFHVESEESEIEIGQAIPFALIATEALDNSVRHAFEQNQVGSVWINYFEQDGERVLIVRDDGCGSGVGDSSVVGTGMRIMRGLAAQLEGVLRIDGDGAGAGTAVELRFQ